ncbi:MAG: RibD family protein [Lachnospiraceae bacterium]|nr:RibD family protein [Lachnospiraceae bacterium]
MRNRPFVVCHILSTLDGKINGEFFGTREVEAPRKIYEELRDYYQCDATLYGTATMAESYGTVSDIPHAAEHHPRKDYIAQTDVRNYIIAVDAEGVLQYQSKYLVRGGRAKAHVIEVLTERVSDSYIAYLRGLDISYIFAGRESLDLPEALQKLEKMFGIGKIMLAGGGKVNQSFLQDGLIDELSLVIAPLVEGDPDAVAVFERGPFLGICPPKAFHLKEARTMEGDSLWLRYTAK